MSLYVYFSFDCVLCSGDRWHSKRACVLSRVYSDAMERFSEGCSHHSTLPAKWLNSPFCYSNLTSDSKAGRVVRVDLTALIHRAESARSLLTPSEIRLLAMQVRLRTPTTAARLMVCGSKSLWILDHEWNFLMD